MRRTLQVIIVFYRKLLLPALCLALAFGLAGAIKGLATFFSYFLSAFCIGLLFTQILVYELMSSQSYLFLNNMGYSRRNLWLINTTVCLIIYLLKLMIL